jgi:hypothetical protein
MVRKSNESAILSGNGCQSLIWLGWPDPGQVLNPDGEGARACLRLAQLKIGGTLRRQHNVNVEIGILTPDPRGDSTAAPLAVVCQFSTAVSDEVLDEAHRLAWNFSRSAVLVTLEPNRLLAWSCLQDPNQGESMRRVCELSEQVDMAPDSSDQERIRELLHWVSLATGHLQKQMPDHFPGEGVPYFDAASFPDDVFLEFDAAKVNPWREPRVASSDSTDFSAFRNPQLLIKQSIVASTERFRAALIKSNDPEWGVICKKTYLSVRDAGGNTQHINAACIAYNSFLAPYFLFLTSSRLGHYITEVNSNELMTLPLPTLRKRANSFSSSQELDKAVRSALSLTNAESALIDDVLRVNLPDALRQTSGPARTQTRRVAKSNVEPEFTAFADTFLRVIQETFGNDKLVSATILQEPRKSAFLPLRVATFHIGDQYEIPIQVETIEVDGLLDRLGAFHRDVLSRKARTANDSGLGFQRVAFLFHKVKGKPGQNLTIIKPDEYRYWTRSQAMRDADELSVAILRTAKGRR